MPGIKITNEYARELGEVYGDMPKAVLAAVAVSALTVGGDHLDKAVIRVVTEWDVLHAAGIVSQPVPAKFRHYINHEEAL
jgi:hypothetical protein